MLANPSLTVAAGTDLTGGGAVSLGGNVTLNLDTSKVPTLAAASNTFTGSITASSFSGSGSGLSNLNASNLSLGTVPTSALSGTYNVNISGNAATASSASTAASANNALNLNGQPASSYATTGVNAFTGNQSVTGNLSASGSVSGGAASFSGALSAAGVALPATGTATSSAGYNSNPLDLSASVFNGTSAVSQDFRWVAEAANNNSGNASATLNLQFGANGGTPNETGLSIASNGIISFAANQTFPGVGGGTITGVAAGTGLTGGGSSGNVTLNLDTSKVPTLAAASNTFTGSISAASFSGSGAGLANLNASNLSSGTLPSSALSGAYSQALTFSNASNSLSGNGAGLTNLTPGNLSAGTAGININGNAATATNAAMLGGMGAGTFAQLGAGSNMFTGSITAAGSLTAGGITNSSINTAGVLHATSAGVEGTVTDTRNVVFDLQAPTSSDDSIYAIFDPPVAVHLRRFACGVTGSSTPSVVANLYESGPVSLLADQTCTYGSVETLITTTWANGSSQCGATTSCAVAAHTPITLHVGTVSGTVTNLAISVEYTVDGLN
jgi:hypothetical protein